MPSFCACGVYSIDERHVEEGGTVVSLNNTVVMCKRTLADAPFLLQSAWIMYSCALEHTLYNIPISTLQDEFSFGSLLGE